MKSTDKIFDVKAGDFPFEGEGGGGSHWTDSI